MASDHRASSDGATGIGSVIDGQPQVPLTDEFGRLWIRAFVNGAPVDTANPMPVTVTGGVTAEIEGNVVNDAPDGATKPVKTGGLAVATVTVGLASAVATGDRVNSAYDNRGRQLVLVQGTTAHGAPVSTQNAWPVLVSGMAAASRNGHAAVAADAAVIAAFNTTGQLQVSLAGAGLWTKFNTVLATPATTFAVVSAAAILGRIAITLDEATAMYALVYDGTSTAGTLIDRFYIPASGTAVRDYTTEGGLNVTTGVFVALTTDPGAVTAPATGGFAHAIYQLT